MTLRGGRSKSKMLLTVPYQFWTLRCTPQDTIGGPRFIVESAALGIGGTKWCFAKHASEDITSGASTNLCYRCQTDNGNAPSTKVSVQPILLLISEGVLYIELLNHNNHGKTPSWSIILWCRIISNIPLRTIMILFIHVSIII